MLKILKFIAYFIAGALIIGALFYYGKDIVSVFNRIKWGWVMVLILLQIPMIALGGLAFQSLCACYQIRMRWQEWAGLSFIANLLNQLLPYRPGMAFRYYYLRKTYHMKVDQFIYIMLIYFLLMIIVGSLFAFIGWIFSDLPQTLNQLFLLSFFIGILTAGFLCWLKIKNTNNNHLENATLTKFLPFRYFQKAIHALQILVNHPRVLIESVCIFIILNLITTLIFYITFMAISSPLPFKHCLFLVGILLAVMTLPITPGNIGVLEALFGTLTQMIYQDFSLGFSAIALYRTTQWIPSVILGTSFSLSLSGSIIPSFGRIKFGVNSKVD